MHPTATASFGTFSGRSCQESQLGFNLLAELWRGEAAIAEAEADEGLVLAHRHLFRPPAARSVGHRTRLLPPLLDGVDSFYINMHLLADLAATYRPRPAID